MKPLPQLEPTAYVTQMAVMLNLPLPPEHQTGVVENLVRMQAIAQLVMSFPLSDTVDNAPVFRP